MVIDFRWIREGCWKGEMHNTETKVPQHGEVNLSTSDEDRPSLSSLVVLLAQQTQLKKIKETTDMELAGSTGGWVE
jgi:hypothetical protein